MKIPVTKGIFFGVVTFLLLVACGERLATRKELRNQDVPAGLKNRVWRLAGLYNNKAFDPAFIMDFNNAIEQRDCSFTFEFVDGGELNVTFRDRKFIGKYLVEGNQFRFIYDGFREKIVWTTNPECKITPTELGYVFNSWSPVKYSLQGDNLSLKYYRGDSLVLVANR